MTKTNDLVANLSRGDPRPAMSAPTTTLAFAAALALVLVLLLSIAWLNPRADLTAELASHNRIFLLKLIFTVSVVAGALLIVRDLSVPGRRIRLGTIVAAIPFIVVMALAIRELAALPTDEWSRHLGHTSWLECLWQIPALSAPAFIILAFAVRRLAPTNLVRTGAFVGLLAGGVGALGYALHCHDDVIAFVAYSYTAAILGMALIGALLGPRVLRWT